MRVGGEPPRRAHEVTESERIRRATNVFGVLNLPVVEGVVYHNDVVRRAYQAACARLGGGVRDGEACRKAQAASRLLLDLERQRRVRDQLIAKGLQPVTRTLRCKVDAAAIAAYVTGSAADADVIPKHRDGKPYGLTRRQMMRRLQGHVQDDRNDPGVGWVDVRYRHSSIGAQLVMAGHVSQSREYPRDWGADPFSMPKDLRKIALRRTGTDFDDSAAYPRAKGAIVQPVRLMIECFLRNRETILQQVGAHLFPAEARAEQRDRAKELFNSLDMHGTVEGFYHRWRLDPAANPLFSLRFRDLRLAPGERFSMRQYQNLQREGSIWLMRRMGAMTQFVKEYLQRLGDAKSRHRLRTPERTLCSYIWAEAEGISRDAKLQWSARRDYAVHNLQHDGVILDPSGSTSTRDVERELTRACSHALGYEQPVETKPM